MSPRALGVASIVCLLCWGALFLAATGLAEASCQTSGCWKRVHAKRAWNVCVRRHGGEWCTWRNRYRRLPAADQRWVRCIAYWETYGTPWPKKARVVGTWGHLGSTQFAASTARSAGFRRPVTSVTLYEQLVRSVWWARRAGKSQWSTAGRCA